MPKAAIGQTTCNIGGRYVQKVHPTTKIVMKKGSGSTALLLSPGLGTNQYNSNKK